MNKVALIIIDPLGNFDLNDVGVIERHKKYWAELQLITEIISDFNIFTCSTKSSPVIDNELQLRVLTRSRNSFLFFVFRAYKIIKQNYSGKCILVAPDPTLSYLVSWMISVIFRVQGQRKIPIQLQIHADLPTQLKKSPKAFLLQAMWKFSIRRADQIRFVGREQFKRITRSFNFRTTDVFIAPVPIDYGNKTTNKHKFTRLTSQEAWTVAFVGRIHKERGLENFITILTELNDLNQNFKVAIVGSGPNEEEFLFDVQSVVGTERVEFAGWLSQAEIEKKWQKILILINSTSSESYGRTVREALYHGTKVLAIESSGINDLRTYVSETDLYIYDFNLKFSNSTFTKFFASPVGDYRSILQNESHESIKRLTFHWEQIAKLYYKEI